MSDATSGARWKRLLERVGGGRVFVWTLVVALTVPLFLSKGLVGGADVALPRIFSGDEPHYLVMLQSLVEDGDLDLRNNYEAARRGRLDAGLRFATAPLDHHTVWFAADGKRWPWYRVFELPDANGPRVDGIAIPPQRLPGVTIDFSDQAEYSSHPAGLPLLLAPVLAPFRGTALVEPLAILFTTFALVGTALFTRRLFGVFSRDRAVVNVATLLTVLATPLWAYGRILATEGWLACCCTGAMALALGADAPVLAGVLVAVGMQMKPPFALVAVPLLVDALSRRDVRRLFALGIPVGVGAAAVLASNLLMFDSPFRAAQAWENGNLAEGAAGLLFSWNHGLFVFAPAAIVALFGWRSLWRAHAREARILASTFAVYWILMGLWRDWRGGYSYGPRLIVPVIPLLMAGLVPVLERLPSLAPRVRRELTGVCVVSLVVSAIGGVANFAFWGKHPLVEPFLAWARGD